MTASRKVAVLFEYPTLLGGERSWLAAWPEIRASGIDVVALIAGHGALGDELERLGVPVEVWATGDAAGPGAPLEARRAALSAALERVRPAALHANSLSMTRLSGPVVEATGLPSLGHLRDIVGLSARAVADVNLHPRILAVSDATRRWHVEQGLDGDRVLVCHNGVDLEAFRPRTATGGLAQELGLRDGARLVVSIGQIGMRKAPDVFLEAAALVAAEDESAVFVLVGERHSTKDEAVRYEADLHASAEQEPLAGRARFVGYRDDVAGVLGEATLLVHAARQEPLGRVLLEAAAAGCPIVATEAGGTREIFPRGEEDGARLVDIDDADAMAKGILALLSDDARCARVGESGRRRAEAAFDAREAGRRLAEHYRETLGS